MNDKEQVPYKKETIATRLEELHQEIGQTRDALNELIKVLRPVLIPEELSEKEAAGGPMAPESDYSELNLTLKHLSDQVRAIKFTVNNTIEQADL